MTLDRELEEFKKQTALFFASAAGCRELDYEHTLLMGEELVHAKERVGRGNYLPFLKAYWPMSEKAARNYKSLWLMVQETAARYNMDSSEVKRRLKLLNRSVWYDAKKDERRAMVDALIKDRHEDVIAAISKRATNVGSIINLKKFREAVESAGMDPNELALDLCEQLINEAKRIDGRQRKAPRREAVAAMGSA